MNFNDRELLARTLQAEAGNQGFGGLLDVGSVIMNRVSEGNSNLRDVILKPGQFSAWNSTTGYAGGEQGQDMANMRPDDRAYMVADSLLSGKYTDNTGGATHYYNPSISNPAWGIKAGGDWTKRGDHVFGRADDKRKKNISTGGQPMMQPEQKPTGLLGGLFSDPDKRARLAMALEGMTLNPNRGLMASLQGGIEQRGLDKKEAAAEAKSLAQRNKTVEFLRANGREDLAGLVSQGMMSGSDAARTMTTASKDTSTSAMKNYNEYQRILAEKGPEAAKQFLSTIKSGTTINTGDVGQGNFIYGSKAGLPAGYRLDRRTGEASVIPGGPAATKAQEASEKAIKGETGQDRKDVSFYAAGERILAELGKEGALLPATGLMATAARGTPLIKLFAQRQENVAQDLAIMESQAQFETLADLKAASPTGASGLGQLTDAERKALGKLNANFESSQSEPAIRRTIKSAMILKSYFENGILDPETNKYRNATDEELDQMSAGTVPLSAGGKPLFGDVQRYFGETQAQPQTIDADDGQYTIKEVGK